MRWMVWSVTVLVWAAAFLSFLWSPTAADHQGKGAGHCGDGLRHSHHYNHLSEQLEHSHPNEQLGTGGPLEESVVRDHYQDEASNTDEEDYTHCHPYLSPRTQSRSRIEPTRTSAPSLLRPTKLAPSPTPHAVSRPAATPTRGRHEAALSSERATPVVASHSHTSVPALRPTSTPVPSLVCGWGYLREAATGHTYRVRLADCEHIPHGDQRVNVVDWGVLLNGEWTYAAGNSDG